MSKSAQLYGFSFFLFPFFIFIFIYLHVADKIPSNFYSFINKTWLHSIEYVSGISILLEPRDLTGFYTSFYDWYCRDYG
jgi:hypothetical protein